MVTAFDFYKFNTKFGILKTLFGIDYQRCLEYPLVYNNLDIRDNLKILDIGSGKHSIFPAFVTYYNDCITYATDINEKYVALQQKRCKRIKKLAPKINNKKLIFDVQDATNLTYENEYFDRIAAISTIEHIPNDGDKKAMEEIRRVLKKGGRAVITLPYSYNNYFEQYLHRKVYDRDVKNEKGIFFVRYYNDDALKNRIIIPSELNLKKLEYLGEEGLQFYYKVWLRIPFRGAIKYLIGFILPLFSYLFFKKVNNKNVAQIVILVFEK